MPTNCFPSPCVEWVPQIQLSDLQNPSFHWAQILRCTLIGVPALGLPPMAGAIFSGPQGNGRHTTAEALAGSMKNLNFHCFLRISGCTMDTEDVSDACAVLDSVAAELRRQGKLCLLLDSPEDSRHSLAIQEYLYQMMCEFNSSARRRSSDASGFPYSLFVIIITSDPGDICSNLHRLLTLCHCPKPDLEARQKWLERIMTKSSPIKVDDMDHFAVARETKDFSWRQMKDLRFLLLRAIATKFVNNIDQYNPEGIEGMEKKILTSGQIHLAREDVLGYIAGIRAQGIPSSPSSAGPVQFVTVAGNGAVGQASGPPASDPPLSKEAANELIEKHRDSDSMPPDVFLDIDSL